VALKYDEEGDQQRRFDALNRAAKIDPADEETKQDFADYFRKTNPDNPMIEKYIESSGIESDEPLSRSLDAIYRWLKYDVDCLVYHENFGVGRVKRVNTELKKIVIDFEKKKDYSMSISAAEQFLQVLDEGHFLRIRYEKPDRIKQMYMKEPFELFTLILKSFKRPMTIQEMKNQLCTVLDKNEMERFFREIRTFAEREQRIKVSVGTPKTFQWVESQIPVEQRIMREFRIADIQSKVQIIREYGGKIPELDRSLLKESISYATEVMQKEPWAAIEIFIACEKIKNRQTDLHFQFSYDEFLKRSEDDAVNIYLRIILLEHKKRLFESIKEIYGDRWVKLSERIFLQEHSSKMWEHIIGQLIESGETRAVENILNGVLSGYMDYPDHFMWFCKRSFEDEKLAKLYLKINVIYKLIDILMSRNLKSHHPKAKEFLFKAGMLDKVLRECSADEARQFFDFTFRLGSIDPAVKDEIIKSILLIYPEFEVEQQGDWFWVTETSLRKKQDEYSRLVNVEIPEVKREISRAASEGDLSENFSFQAAKQKEHLLQSRAKMLKNELRMAKVIDLSRVSVEEVHVGTVVKLKRTDGRRVEQICILGPWDAEPERGIISYKTPIAEKLLNRKVGECVVLEGGNEYQIEDIKRFLDFKQEGG
jgi:transcription elongation GreA/GreB family factor